MAIRKHVCWDQHRQCFVGHVDYGSDLDSDTTVASEALVFLVVDIFASWKQPIAYFLTNGTSGSSLAQLLKHALERLHSIGVNVVTLTLDGHQSNQAAVKKMGAVLKGNIKSSFPHPSDSDRNVHVIFDACHMLKLVRNALYAYGKWKLIRQLHFS